MATSKQNVRLQVVTDGVVDLGGGKFLAKGVYPGWIETMHIAMRGQTVNQISRVMLSLTEAQIASTLGVEVNPNRLGADVEVGSYYSKGDIRNA